MKSIEHEKRKGPSVYLSFALWSNKEVECPCQIDGGTLATKATFQNSPNGKTAIGKNKLPTLLFIECLEFSKYIVIYFVLKSKLFWQKWVFIFIFL